MKRFILGLLCIIFLLTACGQSTPAPQATPKPDHSTSTPSPLPTVTASPIASITPLSTIPTFTPTFDVATIVTVTPAPKAECPKEDGSLNLNFRFDDYSVDADQEIPEFLHNGGAMKLIVSELSRVYGQHSYRFTDITNDGIPDLIFDGFRQLYDTFFILWCQDGQYAIFSGENDMGVSMGNAIHEIIDMNKNGLPEIVIYKRSCTGIGCYRFFIGEWDGKTFINLAPEIYLNGVHENKIEIRDTHNDGALELILVGGDYDFNIPWRQSVHTYAWNGSVYIEQPLEYVRAIYRFQAIQDADATVVVGKLDRAMQLYREAISNQKLEWWSVDRQKYEQAIVDAPWFHEPTPSVVPSEDLTEYPRLAAYAYYRIMLIHLAQGSASDATTTYNTLQQTFGNDLYGHPYVEMATAFWEAYQSAHFVYDGCAAAIQYASEHPDLLIPLGSDYHGSQAKIYKPEDVCPFR